MRQNMHLGNLKGCLTLCWKETQSFNCNSATYDVIATQRFPSLWCYPNNENDTLPIHNNDCWKGRVDSVQIFSPQKEHQLNMPCNSSLKLKYQFSWLFQAHYQIAWFYNNCTIHHQLILNFILFSAESPTVVNIKISHCDVTLYILVYRYECYRWNCCLYLHSRRRVLLRRRRQHDPLTCWCLHIKLHTITLPLTIIFILLYFLLGSLIPTKEEEGRNTLVMWRVLPCVTYAHSSKYSSVCVSMTSEKLWPQEKKIFEITS